ncbi:MFS transporter [Tsukamurella sp. 8F]|uniref:MFS transporter n=1 Tax=unclassified Tsukamurella TaxID=2633480 RepID=UPI0023B9FAED|nr:MULTISPECIES: MFS transporter [unclassified Tsukamurella]MDF0532303.1 MFS transporter [Tsukamurella sp. 8J]MDF0588994.1 MFS transporter [Tsukamurella sp. 8F]
MVRRIAVRDGTRLGPAFGWLWAGYAVSAYGTGIGFGAFSIVAVLALDAGTAEVAALSSAGLALGAVVAIPLGPWVEFHAKRSVMIATDLVRCASLATVPIAYWLGLLTFWQLLAVSVVAAAAKIAFTAACGAYLRSVVSADRLLVATGRFESTTWSATVVGPPAGGALIAIGGPAVTLIADAASYLLSACAVGVIRAPEPPTVGGTRKRWSDLAGGWHYLLAHPTLRRLFANSLAVNALIMAGEPVLSVLLLRDVGVPVWQYTLVFAGPCVCGLVGARLAPRAVRRCGTARVLRGAGALRACWPVGLACAEGPTMGPLVVAACEAGLILCCGLYNPVLAAYRLESISPHLRARVLAAWSTAGALCTASATAAWGVLAEATGPRGALAIAGVLLLATPLLLPRTLPGPSAQANSRACHRRNGEDTPGVVHGAEQPSPAR